MLAARSTNVAAVRRNGMHFNRTPFSAKALRPSVMMRGKTQSVSEADLPLGTVAPNFELPDVVSGKQVSLADFKGAEALLVTFICVHCPYVVHLKEDLAKLAQEYAARGGKVVAISSNSLITHRQKDGPDKMKEDVAKFGYTFPFLLDETQAVAKAYKAACTPEFYVFDKELKLAYHGQWDTTRPKQDPPQVPTGKDIRAAMDATLAGKPVPGPTRPSIGCNIKWTPGGEPNYYGAQLVSKV